MADQSNARDIADLDAQITEQQTQVDSLRAQIGGQTDGPMDPEDTAAALTNVEELEGVLDALRRRRNRLAGD